MREWADVPDRLMYLREAATKFGTGSPSIDEMREFARSLDPEALAELASVYEEIVARGDAGFINAYLNACNDYKGVSSGPSCIFRLLLLFDALAELEISPFSLLQVRYAETLFSENPRKDWSRVSTEYHYLIALAEKYGNHWSDAAITNFLDQITPEQYQELKAVAHTIHAKQHFSALEDLFSERLSQLFPEVVLLYGLIGILDALGFELQ